MQKNLKRSGKTRIKMKINDIYLAFVSWGKGGKQRPILILQSDNNTLSFYAITSKYHHKSKEMQAVRYPIVDWKHAGLNKPSYIVIDNKYQMLKFGEEFIKLGHLTDRDKVGLRDFVRNYFNRH